MSIFDLKQSASELPSLNQGTAKLTYQQVPPTRDVTTTAFPNGAIRMKFETSGSRWWIPSRSYIRMRCSLFKADGTTQPLLIDDVAPNMGLMGSLFQSGEFRIADKTVSRISNFMPQIDALEKRLGKSKSWLDGVGKDLEKWDPKFQNRQNEICSDGYIADENYMYVADVPGIAADTFGFDIVAGPNTINVETTGIMTFAAGAGGVAVDIENTQVLHVGDLITLDAEGQTLKITRILGGLTCNVEATDGVIVQVAARSLVAADLIHPYANRVDNTSPQRSGMELIWQPPLSIFKVPHGMPSGSYELVLTPHSLAVYKKRAIESLAADLTAGTDFDFVVDDMYLYLSTVEGPSVDNLSYFMSLEETRCQATQISTGGGLQQKNYDVSPAAYALTVAFQNTDLSDTRKSSSKFKFTAPNATVPSGELDLARFYIQYNGENKPSPDADVQYNSPNARIASRYAESLLFSGSYFDCGGGESLNDWIDRGMYMYYSYPKDGSSESTRVNVNYEFTTAVADGLANVLLFDHYKVMVLISIVNGRVVDVIQQDG